MMEEIKFYFYTVYLLKFVLSSFLIIGVHVLFSEGYIFGTIGDKIRNLSAKRSSVEFPEGWIHKPLIGCPPCMASFWGIFCFWFYGIPIFVWQLPFYIITLSGITYILYNIIYHE